MSDLVKRLRGSIWFDPEVQCKTQVLAADRIEELEGLLEVTENNLEAMERDDKDLRGFIDTLEKDIDERNATIVRLREDVDEAIEFAHACTNFSSRLITKNQRLTDALNRIKAEYEDAEEANFPPRAYDLYEIATKALEDE